VAIFLGVCVAACFGSGDFLGGLASRKISTLTVLLFAQGCSLALAIVYACALSGHATGRDIAFGAIAGGLNVAGVGVLYHGLATGRIGVVAPITAVVAAVIPVVYGTATGERPSTVALVGVGCAIVAGGLIAREHSDVPEAHLVRELLLSGFAGTAFGASFILYAETTEDSGFWPLLAARLVAVPLVVVALLVTRTRITATRHERIQAVGAGVLDVSATALLLLAVREGLKSLVAPLAALAPAFTVVLAWFVLSEPVARWQIVGLLLALVGLVLIATG
jgi:drug/metabolite transporter (DMT)-like permease